HQRVLLFLPCFVHYSRAHLYLPSFPTRRSSDLADAVTFDPASRQLGAAMPASETDAMNVAALAAIQREFGPEDSDRFCLASWERSEEHTSELQSRVDLVCRLLLEKKKQREAVTR